MDSFYSTWDSARQTYGEGTPATGEQFDNSAKLTQMGTDVEGAAPSGQWTGAAAEAYDKANKEHREVFTRMANLDQRLATEVNNSAQAVDAGRRNLDAIRQWVQAAEASVPEGKNSEQIRMAIAKKGLAQLEEAIKTSNTESNAISERIKKLGNEFEELNNQRFGGKKGEEKGDDKKKDDVAMYAGGEGEEGGPGEGEAPSDAEAKEQAQATVEGALSGNAENAAEVDRILDSITDAQLAGTEPLSQQQAQILSQMQAQTHNKSLDELEGIRQGLSDDNKDILADSWHLMSDPDVKFPQAGTPTDLFPEITPQTVSGSMDQLPTSIQDVLKTPAWEDIPNSEGYGYYDLPTKDQLHLISGMIADGDERFQKGNFLDGGMMSRATEILEHTQETKFEVGTYEDADAVMQDIFRSAGRDDVVAHELLTGKPFDGGPDLVTGVKEGQEFLNNMSMHSWDDNGAAARTLTDWIDDGSRMDGTPQDQMAGEAAHAVASYLGEKQPELANMGAFGGAGLGGVNPDLVRGYGEALAPYQEAMIGDHSKPTPGFGMLEGEPDNYDTARNAFAVIHSDPEASKAFTEHAYRNILEYQQQTADAAGSNNPADGAATGHAGRMLGVLNSSATLAEVDPDFGMREDALGLVLDEAGGKLPIVGSVGADHLKDAILGMSNDYKVETNDFKGMSDLNNYEIASGLFSRDIPYPPQMQPFVDLETNTLMTPSQVPPAQQEAYYQALADYTALPAAGGWGTVAQSFGNEYDQGAGARR